MYSTPNIPIALVVLLSHPLAIAQAPSNEELHELLLEAQRQIAQQQTEIESLKSQISATVMEQSAEPVDEYPESTQVVGINSSYSFRILDHAENTNTKQRLQLEAIQNNELNSRITLGGQIAALANYQKANEDNLFGWLMRHPTSNNQIGKTVSEAVVHSANLNLTGLLSESLTSYVEMLYNPEQNFAANSTITGLPRNNVNVRRAWILWGNLKHSPLYGSIGKMDIPFGWNDTVSPFTNSTNWHSFAGLAYGATIGYMNDRYHFRAMTIQGGAQFRNANTPVEDTNVPSRLNNFAIDANFNVLHNSNENWNVGVSYQYGTAYCQNYLDDPSTHVISNGVTLNPVPQGVRHFEPCTDNNDAFAVYTSYHNSKWLLAAEYAETLDVWPGTSNPYIPEFQAEENTTFTVGGRYTAELGLPESLDLSLEFSRFKAGESGSPWEKQDQVVLGMSYFLRPHVNIFSELIRVDGWVPLNFLSGGNPGSVVGTSWSSQSSHTNIITIGAQTGF